jgi:hypothetical protein
MLEPDPDHIRRRGEQANGETDRVHVLESGAMGARRRFDDDLDLADGEIKDMVRRDDRMPSAVCQTPSLNFMLFPRDVGSAHPFREKGSTRGLSSGSAAAAPMRGYSVQSL